LGAFYKVALSLKPRARSVLDSLIAMEGGSERFTITVLQTPGLSCFLLFIHSLALLTLNEDDQIYVLKEFYNCNVGSKNMRQFVVELATKCNLLQMIF
jgi:hypothetical protein